MLDPPLDGILLLLATAFAYLLSAGLWLSVLHVLAQAVLFSILFGPVLLFSSGLLTTSGHFGFK